MKKKILIVDNYDSFTFNLIQQVELCGYGVNIVKNDELIIDECRNFRKIIISPGAGIPRTSGKILELITKLSPTHSILGVCLGHQAIAEAFGGTLFQLERPKHGIHEEVLQISPDLLFNGLPNHFQVGLYHSWAVSKANLPVDLQVTAVSRSGVIMALSHKKFDVRGIQFHPESVMTHAGSRIMENWLKQD